MTNPRRQLPNLIDWRRKRATWVGLRMANHAIEAIKQTTGETFSEQARDILAGHFKSALLKPQLEPRTRPTRAAKRRLQSKRTATEETAP